MAQATAPGKVIVLTGASRGQFNTMSAFLIPESYVQSLTRGPGIGLAIARYLLKQQCKLVVTARTKIALESLRSQYPEQVECAVGDMADLCVGADAVALALSTWHRLDAVVVNHGVLDPIARVANANFQAWIKAYNINFLSAVAIV